MLWTNQDLDPVRLRQAFGTFPTGVVAVAAVLGERPVGLAASSFTTVSLDPPLVSVNLATTSRTWPDLRRADRLGVTVLADHQDRVCRQLAGPVEHRFDGVDWTISEHGAVTLDQGLASSSAPSTARSRRATTCWCCCSSRRSSTPLRRWRPSRWSSTAAASGGWRGSSSLGPPGCVASRGRRGRRAGP